MIVKLKKGLDIKLAGTPHPINAGVVRSENYTVYPSDFVGFAAKPAVREGDKVVAGSPLLYDKKRPEIKIVSPVSGEVIAVNRGEKRRLTEIVIHSDGKNKEMIFNTKDANSPEILKSLLASAGIFAFIRQRPYDIIASPTDIPRDIFVTAFSSAPLAPNTDFIIKGNEDDFQSGLDALAKLTSGKVHLGIRFDSKSNVLQDAKNVEVTRFDGPHPSGNVGVQINNVKPVNKGEIVWTTDFQAVIFIGRLLNRGIVDFSRPVALTGSEIKEDERCYVTALPGVAVSEWLTPRLKSDSAHLRVISGNVLTGINAGIYGSLHYFDNQISVIPDGYDKNEFLGWILPGPDKYSVAWSFLSRFIDIFRRKEYVIDARIKGGKRAMIFSGEWENVLPMDILPEYLIRAIITFDIEKMENLGVYEIAPEDFALCEFVDTSKMELQKIVREGLDLLYKEMN
ncbi:MAG: Na(+)-translocating NADH-quinone reductase subunit A [Dysgonamonadaceae bacterium]|jgi:Na+-transporting NADH:ubiquinone oxidoreductase subunit A|nr:Na(+)-translocating NADH-quinone reductase subunit A [Dysgonamonadaceae bacterium]